MQGAQKARDILERFHIDLNDPVNGVFLPIVRGVSPACYHPEVHTEAYFRYLEKMLSDCESVEEVFVVLEEIAERLLDGSCPH